MKILKKNVNQINWYFKTTFTSRKVCLALNCVWQRDNQILKPLIQPLPCYTTCDAHMDRKSLFLWLFNHRRKLSISSERTHSTKPQMAFFSSMWWLWKTPLTSETFPFSLSSADIVPLKAAIPLGYDQQLLVPFLQNTTSSPHTISICHPHGWQGTKNAL